MSGYFTTGSSSVVIRKPVALLATTNCQLSLLRNSGRCLIISRKFSNFEYVSKSLIVNSNNSRSTTPLSSEKKALDIVNKIQ